MYLGMSQADSNAFCCRGTNEGSKLAGNSSLWTGGDLENDAAFGTSGFTALPGGSRSYSGPFDYLGNRAHFWSASEYNSSLAWLRGLFYDYSEVHRFSFSKPNGFSVRCLKD